MKRTYQPSKIRRIRKYGFMARMATVGGRRVLKNRRLKGRKHLSVSLKDFGTRVEKNKKFSRRR